MYKQNENSAAVATATELKNYEVNFQAGEPKNFGYFTIAANKPQDRFRRHFIFKCLIAGCRSERFQGSAAGFIHIAYDLPDLSKSGNFGSLDDDEIYRLGVCPIPTEKQNADICRRLQKLFGDLSVCNVFIKTETGWRLDISENLAKFGLFLPIRNAKTGLIERLRVYRFPDDSRPFILQLKGGTGING